MEIMTIDEIKKLKFNEITEKIIEAQKHIFELKFKQSIRQTVKSHLFKKYRRMLAQLLTVQHNFDSTQ